MLDRIFENPRVHSDKGYFEKEKKEEVTVEYDYHFQEVNEGPHLSSLSSSLSAMSLPK